MFGPALLVAPVVQQGALSRSVYLPAGSSWVDYYTDTTYAGGQTVTANAPVDRKPVFVRAGSIVPAGANVQYVSDTSVAPAAIADIYPGPDSGFTLYEDDGLTTNYANGVSLQTSISRSTQANGATVQIRRLQGSWTPPAREWALNLHAYPVSPSSVQLNGVRLIKASSESALLAMPQGWFYRTTDQRLLIRFPDGPNAFVVAIQN